MLEMYHLARLFQVGERSVYIQLRPAQILGILQTFQDYSSMGWVRVHKDMLL